MPQRPSALTMKVSCRTWIVAAVTAIVTAAAFAAACGTSTVTAGPDATQSMTPSTEAATDTDSVDGAPPTAAADPGSAASPTPPPDDEQQSTPQATAIPAAPDPTVEPGRYQVWIDYEPGRDARSTLRVTIDDQSAEVLPRWTPAYGEVVPSIDPPVRAFVTRPSFESAGAGTDLQLINGLVEDFVNGELDPWLAGYTELLHPDPHGPSEFELVYDITLEAPDLVSVHFWRYSYICCQPYPNVGHRALVIDLAASTSLAAADILDTNRLDDVQRIWAAAVDRDQGELGIIDWIEPGRSYFDAISLTPTGVRFGTDRGAFGAAVGPIDQIVTFEELGSLVNPELVARARAGFVPEPR